MPTSVSSEVSLTPSKRSRYAHRDGRSAVAPVVVVGAVHSELRLVDRGRREDVLELQDEVGGNVGNHVVVAQRVRGVVDVGVVDVVADVGRGGVGEAVIEAEHAGIFADRVGGHLGDLVGDAVDRRLPSG